MRNRHERLPRARGHLVSSAALVWRFNRDLLNSGFHGGFRFATLGSVPADTPYAQHFGVFRFGVFEADLRSRELRKQGRQLRVQDQPFAVLALLLERAGTVVTREELRQSLWAADTFVDFEHGLNTAVNKVREALGDSANNPRFIETLPRRGYRFIGTLDGPAVVTADPASPATPASPPVPSNTTPVPSTPESP